MSSLFVKCMQCTQRPATIKCSQCKYGQIFRLCYSCDSQVHNRQGPIDQQHKTEIIPYQGKISQQLIEMYQKAGNSSSQPAQQNFQVERNLNLFQAKVEPKGKPQIQSGIQAQPQQQASFKFQGKQTKPEPPTKEIVNKPFQKTVKDQPQLFQQSLNKEPSYSGQRSSNKARYDQREEDFQNSSQKNSDQKDNQNLINQLKQEQDSNQQLKRELNQIKDSLTKDFEKKLQKTTKDLEKKYNDLKQEGAEDKKKSQQLADDVKKLKDQLKSSDQTTQKKLDQQKKQYEQQLEQMEQVINEKQNQIDEIAQEFQNYNLEDIQNKMEEMANDLNMKDQIIEELQNQVQKKSSVGGEDGNQDEIYQQMEQKDQEIKKLEELIENFKQLYQHMLDEKQVIMEENEKLANENNQFREIFSQNLHLFGIDPNQLEEEGEGEGGEGEGEGEEDGDEEYHQEEGEIIEENEETNDTS